MHRRFLVGRAGECAEKLDAYRSAGVERIMLWPLKDELRQVGAFWEQVIPLAHASLGEEPG